MKYTVHELNTDTYPDFEQLAMKKQGGCWCMYYQRDKPIRVHGEEYNKINRRDKKALIEKGKSRAILVYSGDTPVGWANTALGKNLRELMRAEATRRSVHRKQTRNCGESPASLLTEHFVAGGCRSSHSEPPSNRSGSREAE